MTKNAPKQSYVAVVTSRYSGWSFSWLTSRGEEMWTDCDPDTEARILATVEAVGERLQPGKRERVTVWA